MSVAETLTLPRSRRIRAPGAGGLLAGGVMIYLSVVVLLPLAAVLSHAAGTSMEHAWQAATDAETLSALELTAGVSAGVMLTNAVFGTLIAWVLVRDSFPAKAVLNSLIDLPFALPTIVAGLVLLELYGPQSPLRLNAAYTRFGVLLALLFVTLPFVVRAVQPVLMEMDREVEEAATSLGASPAVVFRRITVPALLPAILSGSALGFARSMGEFGSVVLFSGNILFRTEVASVRIYGQISSGDLSSASVVSMMLLLISLVVLIGTNAVQRWGARHEG